MGIMFCESSIFVIFLLICINYEKIRIVSSERIYGGELVMIGEFPFAAAIESINSNIIWSGTIISDKHILTSAYPCRETLKPPFVNDYVYVGRNTVVDPKAKLYGLRHVTYHPKFLYSKDVEATRYNIAIITLCHRIKFDANTQPAKLTNRDVENGVSAIALGWGLNKEGGRRGRLFKLQTKAYIRENCKNLPDKYGYSTHFCTKNEKEKGLCLGDQGGSLIVNGNVLIGLITHSLKICGANAESTYLNIYECLDFIKAEIHPMTCGRVIEQVNTTTVRIIKV